MAPNMIKTGALVAASIQGQLYSGLVLASHYGATTASWQGHQHHLPAGRACVILNDPGAPGTPYLSGIVPLDIAARCRAMDWKNLGALATPEQTVQALSFVVKHLSVVVLSTFACDGRTFEPGARGKITTWHLMPNNRLILAIEWRDIPGEPGGILNWEVPMSPSMSFICGPDFQFEPIPHKASLDYWAGMKEGDFRRVSLSGRGNERRWTVKQSQNGNPLHILEGDILEVVKRPGGMAFKTVTGAFSGQLVDPIGCPTKPFPHPFFQTGWHVAVVGETVRFRQHSLTGMGGRVLLQTDLDGDVGLQLQKDVGAGSLDGLGQDGHCLFVPAAHLKKISE